MLLSPPLNRKFHNIGLTHVDETGKVKMVNINEKLATKRTSIASSKVYFSSNESFKLLLENKIKKGLLHVSGDVLTVSKIAGICAGKLTFQLIPLCHQVNLSSIDINFRFFPEKNYLSVFGHCETGESKTGVEVEAMVAVSVASLTIFDMCKAVDKKIIIGDLKVLHKSGGKSGDYSLNQELEEYYLGKK
ncbi:Cyclic pyranopterin monophosphate synthase, mitochondrial [Clydaea vesicula]|uniref:Cyclic pyranopterin monophosphate synthase, mitochondrial n=1 Tax=Clydaea vesicula TaxID=447962 RepID=A0AAD5TZH9_9FUNG|nr:Cyclic pyranopterin monophosphate synthase, mitochondrial [Clydaea vesicula]KAJ3378038.1 Cyclic pyranopterin monophosphate synthase, mitochondrial [Lobulomyces angularis]